MHIKNVLPNYNASLGNISRDWRGSINTLWPRQHGRNFADETFRIIFVKEYVYIDLD